MRQILLVAVFCSAALAEIPTTARVGQPVLLIDIYIPGGEVKPLPRRDRTPPIVVRLLETKPAQDGFRYDFEITALDPGKHQLADYLSAVDPAVPPELSDILLDVSSGLPPGLVLPHEQPEAELPELGGYRTKMTVAAAAWLAGLIGIIVWKRRKSDVQSEDPAAPGLAERLEPLLIRASDGTLDAAGRASLERLVIGHWRERFPEIASLPPAEAMVKLRSHPQAAPLLLELELWLHSRDAAASRAEIEALLAPYR